jgi:hypothetical protein
MGEVMAMEALQMRLTEAETERIKALTREVDASTGVKKSQMQINLVERDILLKKLKAMP